MTRLAEIEAMESLTDDWDTIREAFVYWQEFAFCTGSTLQGWTHKHDASFIGPNGDVINVPGWLRDAVVKIWENAA